MLRTQVHLCECIKCQESFDQPENLLHQRMNLFLTRLDEQQRRWFAALESQKLGYGGDVQIALITGLDEKTIRRGRQELETDLAERPTAGVRLPGGGRIAFEKKLQP